MPVNTLVLSWYNRRNIGLTNNFTANRTTTSTTYVELNSEIRDNFLTWGDEDVAVTHSGSSANDGANNTYTSVGFDGTNQENAMAIQNGTGAQPNGLVLVKNGLSEGFHFVTLLGAVAAGTGTYYGAAFTSDTTVRFISSLAVAIRG